MMQHVIAADHTFGVVMIKSGAEAHGPVANPYRVGCIAKVEDFEQFPDGRMNMVVTGQERFKIHELDSTGAYLLGQVEMMVTEQPRTLELVRGSYLLSHLIRNYIHQLARLKLSTFSENHFDLSSLSLPEDPTDLIFFASGILQIPLIEKQTLLETPSAGILFRQVVRILRRELSIENHIRFSEQQSEITHHRAHLN